MKTMLKPAIIGLATVGLFALGSCCNNKCDTKATTTAASATVDLKQSRATEAVIWGIPAVNFDVMYQALVKAGGAYNQFVYWSKPSDWKNQLLTPNTDALYFMPFFNTKDVGPMVLEIPAATGGTIVGSIMDCWQTPLEDVGPAGADKGKGGRYLILPPDYKEKVPAGYIVLPSTNYTGYALLRSMPKTNGEGDIASAVEYAKTIKLYPLSAAASPLQTKFNDAMGMVFDAAIPYDIKFFESLDRIVQSEPWLERDKAMIDMLKSIGIEKGKTFAPDAKTTEMLSASAKSAHAWLSEKYEAFEPYFPGKKWFLPLTPELFQSWSNNFEVENSYPIEIRGITYHWGFSGGKGTGGKTMHQLYVFATRDKDGNVLSGDKNYRLHVPANVPAAQYWSVTVYNRETHTLIRDMALASRSSLQTTLATNADGTVDIYLGLKAPEGKESNWIPTKAGENLEIIFRTYGAEQPIFDKTWVLNDLEEVK